MIARIGALSLEISSEMPVLFSGFPTRQSQNLTRQPGLGPSFKAERLQVAPSSPKVPVKQPPGGLQEAIGEEAPEWF